MDRKRWEEELEAERKRLGEALDEERARWEDSEKELNSKLSGAVGFAKAMEESNRDLSDEVADKVKVIAHFQDATAGRWQILKLLLFPGRRRMQD